MSNDMPAGRSPRWRQRPAGSTWGDFGPDDQLGRLNLITRQKVREGLAEAREGLPFSLSLPLDYPGGNALNPNRHPPVLRPTRRRGLVNFNCLLGELEPGRPDVLSDDLAILHLQYSTQWDGLSHAGSMFDADGDGIPEPVYYNGFRAGVELIGPSDRADAGIDADSRQVDGRWPSTSAAHALGVGPMAEHAVQGRAAMVDLHAHYGDARTLVGYDALQRVLDADRVEIERGDIVCLHTGFAEAVLGMNRQPDPARLNALGAVLDGRDEKLLQWITDTELAAIAADNYAVEAHPAAGGDACCAALPLHEHCLFKLGVHLGELWRLSPLAAWLRAHDRYRFLLTAPPLNLPGAVASPLTPVATV
ncbi:cyclase family protein [Chitinasiproducens palmae]|uniref:Cyclase n=1 Tax=Chitinasiproducens palmae TaxID=1770053 RepID=A0A1H2PJ51_9BURK|nr:cyclase family protein [Chitinasiproducens palmae]SDV46353.1 Putative cyclase [Chitinasiproducens palmae]